MRRNAFVRRIFCVGRRIFRIRCEKVPAGRGTVGGAVDAFGARDTGRYLLGRFCFAQTAERKTHLRGAEGKTHRTSADIQGIPSVAERICGVRRKGIPPVGNRRRGKLAGRSPVQGRTGKSGKAGKGTHLCRAQGTRVRRTALRRRILCVRERVSVRGGEIVFCPCGKRGGRMGGGRTGNMSGASSRFRHRTGKRRNAGRHAVCVYRRFLLFQSGTRRVRCGSCGKRTAAPAAGQRAAAGRLSVVPAGGMRGGGSRGSAGGRTRSENTVHLQRQHPGDTRRAQAAEERPGNHVCICERPQSRPHRRGRRSRGGGVLQRRRRRACKIGVGGARFGRKSACSRRARRRIRKRVRIPQSYGDGIHTGSGRNRRKRSGTRKRKGGCGK